jgi:hypothetical protein
MAVHERSDSYIQAHTLSLSCGQEALLKLVWRKGMQGEVMALNNFRLDSS